MQITLVTSHHTNRRHGITFNYLRSSSRVDYSGPPAWKSYLILGLTPAVNAFANCLIILMELINFKRKDNVLKDYFHTHTGRDIFSQKIACGQHKHLG